MTQANDRLNRVENELGEVRQLLASAATYAESASRGMGELTAAQNRTQTQIDQLGEKQERTQIQIDQLGEKQERTQIQIDQ
ncbi:MAG: 6-aminohexanoate hydrolase, partial [Scytonema sp. PMC 1070.18]|nr:6-aminohexanoate hydrolase [Scytonema sp. PMC 1070.18]